MLRPLCPSTMRASPTLAVVTWYLLFLSPPCLFHSLHQTQRHRGARRGHAQVPGVQVRQQKGAFQAFLPAACCVAPLLRHVVRQSARLQKVHHFPPAVAVVDGQVERCLFCWRKTNRWRSTTQASSMVQRRAAFMASPTAMGMRDFQSLSLVPSGFWVVGGNSCGAAEATAVVAAAALIRLLSWFTQ